MGMVVNRGWPAGPALAVFVVAVSAGRANAASVTVSDGEGCVDRDAIAEQATEILGQPLGAVTGVDFEVALTRAAGGGWKLRLDTVDQGPGDHRRSRELVAPNCAELADAAAVAIAMTVRSRAALAPPTAPPPASSSGPPIASSTRSRAAASRARRARPCG